MKALRLAFVAGLALHASDAAAAGYALDVQSARATGMGTAVTGFIDDSSAIFYNPAGIARGKLLDAQAGVTLIAPSFNFTDAFGVKTLNDSTIVTPVNAYVSGGITDNLSLGVGVFTPFGNDLKWPDGWVGRRQISSISLLTVDINPTVAYRFGPLRIGAGLQIVRGTVRLKKQIAFGETEGSTDLGGGTWGIGGNIGAQFDAIPRLLSLGVHYRSAVNLDFDGLADFGNVPPALQNAIHDQAASTTLLTPDTLAMGVAVHPLPTVILDADVVWWGWGNMQSIDIRFPNDQSGTLANSKPKHWSSGLNYHLGGEIEVDESWRVRAGALFDPSLSPDDTLTPDLPDVSRLNIALGASYVHDSGIRADLGYQHLFLFSRESTAPELPGTYGGSVNLLGVSLGYRTPISPKTL
jgi:long-chain fatty acid transport protein